ncbi:hypothetical protein U27_07033 [Candidatus Vecturithrix granuli]|uniref:Uncharacterized protein n=1 Tax=Vecturithrix granuli TaxID=1499967 RepID=A0A081C641_VECG1|nr:hypothetical protein U27_07033 [Candidatus Vecturithrix granuli]
MREIMYDNITYLINGGIRDNPGLSRALTGDIEEVIEDFQFFVEWTENAKEKVQPKI